MSKADIIVGLILLLGGFLGYKRGFLMELFFLIGIILGVFLGFKLMAIMINFLQKQFNADRTFLPYLSFLIIFFVVTILVIYSGRSIKHSVDKTFLGRMDEVAGAVLGIFKYAFCLSVLLWLAASLHYALPTAWTRGSVLYSATTRLAPGLASTFGDFLPFFKEIFRRF